MPALRSFLKMPSPVEPYCRLHLLPGFPEAALLPDPSCMPLRTYTQPLFPTLTSHALTTHPVRISYAPPTPRPSSIASSTPRPHPVHTPPTPSSLFRKGTHVPAPHTVSTPPSHRTYPSTGTSAAAASSPDGPSPATASASSAARAGPARRGPAHGAWAR